MTTIAAGTNTTSDPLRSMREQLAEQKRLALSAGSEPTPNMPLGPVPTGGGTATGDPFGPRPTFPTVGGTPRPIDPGFWNPGLPQTGPSTAPAPGLTPTLTDFGPGDNMIGKQINLPETSREELVQRMFNAVTPEMDRQAGIRREDLSRRIAGLGRAGMGGVNTSFGNLEALEAQRRSELLGKLSAEGASGDISDMFKRAGLMQDERGYQHGLDREAIKDQQIQAALLQQLGFGFDPAQSGNLTNALLGGANTAAQSANASGGFWDTLGSVGANVLVNSI